MADQGFEPYDHNHVPQQSRRDKLRVNNTHLDHNNLQGFADLFPLYDPSSLISSDFINCAAPANVHRQGFGPHTSSPVKEEGMNLMGFANSSAITDHMYVDPSAETQLNPSSIQDSINGNPYAYTSPYRGVLEQSFHGNEVVVYKPEPINSGQSLSLSLSSHQAHNSLPLELNLQKYNSSIFSNNNHKVSENERYIVGHNNGGGSSSIEISKSTVPLGPFTGYASVLKGSRFLKPAQQLLEELCDMGSGVYVDRDGPDPYLSDPTQMESLSPNGVVDGSLSSSDGGEQTRKKSRLLSMLDEVYKRYKQYYQQMQAAVASFESVSGLNGAAPFASLAVKAMSKHFRCLKNAITDQLQFTGRSNGKIHCEKDETQGVLDNSNRPSYNLRPFHSTGFADQPVWRPQRGLPERAVTVLRAWLFEHFLHPYPTDTDKLMLAKQTGLSRNQVSNWFINARVRLWKPMVEEIHMLETRQGQKGNNSQRDDQQAPNAQSDHLPTSCSTEFERIGDFALKRTRDQITQNTPSEIEGPLKFPFDHNLLHNNPHSGIMSNNGGGGVSLTLGLHQNGVGFPESSLPINAARRFGLDGEGYSVSGFGGQNRQLGREVMDGQYLHEFVG